jgi:hypothetical protein
MKKIIIASAMAAVMLSPVNANAFSFRKFITNPFKVSISSVLNPFHVVYKFNKITGQNPTAGIPAVAFTPANVDYFKQTKEWRWSWEEEPIILRPVDPPPYTIPTDPPRPIPPEVTVTPPCKRGGPGITPC